MADSIVLQKSKLFSVRIIKLHKYLCDTKKEFIISKQIVRSGTSMSANLSEASCAISRNDFLAKTYIAFKECKETLTWLELLKNSNYLTQNQFESLNADCEELRKLLSSITKTLRYGKTPNS
jgi:four helix bundle protein